MSEAPRYLKFVCALALGTAAAAILPACGDDAPPPDSAGGVTDAARPDRDVPPTIDAGIPDVVTPVDGPLPPPDLPA